MVFGSVRVTEPPARFAYHRSVTPNLGVLLTLALIETVVVHLLAAALWGTAVAVVLAVIDVSAVVALLLLLRAIRREPVTIADRMLTMRTGQLKVISIPVAQVTGLSNHWDPGALKAPDVVNLALATWPNIMVHIDPPIPYRRRRIAAVAHKLDDPEAFARAIRTIIDEETVTRPSLA